MNQLLEPETSESTPKRRPRFWQDEDAQSIIVGIILTFILWPLLVLGFSWAIGHLHGRDDGKFKAAAHGRQFNIQLAPQELKQPKPPPPNRFVETNPDAPANVPDQTRNFAARNQQAAQEKPTPNSHNDRAATQGRKDIDSTAVVTGRLNNSKPVPSTPPAPEPSKAAQATRSHEQNPLPGVEKNEGDNNDAFATNIAKPAENNQDVPQKTEGLKTPPLIENPDSSNQPIDPNHPRPRPHLPDQNTRSAPIANNPNGVSNVGIIANTAFKSNYGEYLDRLLDTVEMQWYQLLGEASISPPSGTHVLIKFRLNSEGRVTDIKVEESNTGDSGEKYCASAISIPSTGGNGYGKWSSDMVAMLGTEQELAITFYYQ